MNIYFFEIIVEVKKENAIFLITHSNIRAHNVFEAFRYIWLRYTDKSDMSQSMRLIYSKLQIDNVNRFFCSPLDFEIKSAKCIEIDDDDNHREYKETTVRTELSNSESIKTNESKFRSIDKMLSFDANSHL